MIKQGFYIGDKDWYIMAYYDIQSQKDLDEVKEALIVSGCPEYRADEVVWVISMWNKGYTFSNLSDKYSVTFISKATSAEQMYNTIQHELKHIVEHISDAYDVDPKSEDSAYLQGEIASKMFPAASLAFCPVCHELK